MYIPSRGTLQVFQIVSTSITIRETFWWKLVARGCGCEDIHDTKIWSTLIHLTVVYTIMIHILNNLYWELSIICVFFNFVSPCTSCIVHVHVLYQIVNKEWYYYYCTNIIGEKQPCKYSDQSKGKGSCLESRLHDQCSKLLPNNQQISCGTSNFTI